MAQKKDRYPELEQLLTIVIFLDLFLFIGYLICGITSALIGKILLAILCFVLSGYGLWVLFANRELTTPRSLWMSCSFGSIVICTLVSLICNFP